MKYDDLEKTQDLFDIEDVPNPILNIEMEGASKDNLTNELTFGLTETKNEEELNKMNGEEEQKEDNKKKKKDKKSLKEKWAGLSKKKKVLIILGIILVMVIIIGLLIFLLGGKKDEKGKDDKPSVPEVIVEKENYIYKDGVLTFLDKDEKEIGTYECQNKDENLCFVANYSNEDTFDGEKFVYEDGSKIEKRSTIYNDNYVFVYDDKEKVDGNINLYNIKDAKVEGTYELVKGDSESNYVILKDTNGKYGAIELTSEGITEKIEFAFTYLGMVNKDSNVVVLNNDKYYLYTKDGEILSRGLSYEIKSYNNNYIVVDNNGYQVYDYRSNLVIDEKSEYISLMDRYAVLIKDGELFIRDYEGNKYNEKGIRLNSSEYNTLNIYDEDKQPLETKSAFTVSIEGDNINVHYKNRNTDKDELINIHEGEFSSNLEYMNYLGGTLYFYSDEEKKDMLGSYDCTNKNNVDGKTKELNQCNVATESFFSKNEVETDNSKNLGYLPIYNNRYVFILDSMDSKNVTVILYDLKDNKTLTKYAEVDAGAYTKEKKITFVDTEETLVMAKNKNDKYGVIKIGKDTVKGNIGFNYDSMEKLRDYYMAGKSSGTYMLLDKNGENVSGEVKGKIVDYKGNYLKLIDNASKYHAGIFKNDSDITGYLDVVLYDDFFVVVTSDFKVNIALYSDYKLISEEGVAIGKDYKNNYEVSKVAKGYYVKVLSTKKGYIISPSGDIEEV